eukprot:7281263-Lingulodinium_polyedra.AAC.1
MQPAEIVGDSAVHANVGGAPAAGSAGARSAQELAAIGPVDAAASGAVAPSPGRRPRRPGGL